MVSRLFSISTLPILYLTPVATFFMWWGVELSIPENLTKLIMATVVVLIIWVSVFFSRKWITESMKTLPVGIDRLLIVVAAVFMAFLLFGVMSVITEDIGRQHSSNDTGDMIFILVFGGPCVIYLFCLALSVAIWIKQGF